MNRPDLVAATLQGKRVPTGNVVATHQFVAVAQERGAGGQPLAPLWEAVTEATLVSNAPVEGFLAIRVGGTSYIIFVDGLTSICRGPHVLKQADLEVGSRLSVTGRPGKDGRWIARRIVVTQPQ